MEPEGQSTPGGSFHGGHRERLRERFVKSGFAGFHDYEIVELLLSLTTPHRDTKALAKEAMERFGSLRRILEAPVEELRKIKGFGPVNSLGIKIVHEVAREFLKQGVMRRPALDSAQAIFDYLYHSMRDLKNEIFKVIYLNSQNEIVETEDLFEGTVDASVVWTREVVAGAIKNAATGLIFVHNHPSGNPEPSDSDKLVTRDLVYAGRIMQIKVLDHIIIGDNRYFSFAGAGLIDKFEVDFLMLKMKGDSEPPPGAIRSDSAGELPWS
jgi:DNA repair protein RadC